LHCRFIQLFRMSYVPPHKRRVGAAAPSSSRTPSDPGRAFRSTQRDSRRNRSNKNSSGRGGGGGGGRDSSRNHHDEAKANAELFCGSFTFIRCINLKHRPEQWERFRRCGKSIGPEFLAKLRRFSAIDGRKVLGSGDRGEVSDETDASSECPSNRIGIDVVLEWDTTQNAKWDRHVAPGITRELSPGEIGCALSHVSLWRDLVEGTEDNGNDNGNGNATMLIFEDDATFYNTQTRAKPVSSSSGLLADRFLRAFRLTQSVLPDDWDLLYLGFSDRGERRDVVRKTAEDDPDLSVEVFRPTYGFHTHAYAVTRSASRILLERLPVVGPIDVWLANHDWFGLNVYCTVVANEGWKRTGAVLVHQDRSRPSTIAMSSRR